MRHLRSQLFIPKIAHRKKGNNEKGQCRQENLVLKSNNANDEHKAKQQAKTCDAGVRKPLTGPGLK